MRVLFPIHTFFPAARGGCERYTYHLARQLAYEGHEAHVFHTCAADTFAVERHDVDGIGCTVISKRLNGQRISLFAEIDSRVDGAFCDLLRSYQPDVVHINHLMYLSAAIPRLCRMAGIPVLFTVHDYWMMCPRIDLLKPGEELCDGPAPKKCAACCRDLYTRWMVWASCENRASLRAKSFIKNLLHVSLERPYARRRFAKRARLLADAANDIAMFIAPSRFVLRFLEQHAIPPQKLVYCKHGMMPQAFIKRITAPRDGRLRFAYIGALAKHKGADVLLRAFDGFREAELYVYGYDHGGFLRSYSHVFAQDNVHWEGYLADSDKPAALERIDALIVPSVCYETFSLVVHEAFMAGIPVVASNVGALAEAVSDGVYGIHFEIGNPGDLRKKLIQLCHNPEELDRMRKNLPPVKTMPEHAQEILGYYHYVITKNQAARVLGGSSHEAI